MQATLSFHSSTRLDIHKIHLRKQHTFRIHLFLPPSLAPLCNIFPLLSPCKNGTTTSSRSTVVSLLVFHRHGDRSPLKGHSPDDALAARSTAKSSSSNNNTSRNSGGNGDAKATAASDKGGKAGAGEEGLDGTISNAATTGEEFWRQRLVSEEEIRRLDSMYPVLLVPGEAEPIDHVRQLRRWFNACCCGKIGRPQQSLHSFFSFLVRFQCTSRVLWVPPQFPRNWPMNVWKQW